MILNKHRQTKKKNVVIKKKPRWRRRGKSHNILLPSLGKLSILDGKFILIIYNILWATVLFGTLFQLGFDE